MSFGFCVGNIKYEYLKPTFILMIVYIAFFNQFDRVYRIICLTANGSV